MSDEKYALFIESHAVVVNDRVITNEGDWFVPTESENGMHYAEPYAPEDGPLRYDTVIFSDPDRARQYLQEVKLSPEWCVPTGRFKLVRVDPKFRLECYAVDIAESPSDAEVLE